MVKLKLVKQISPYKMREYYESKDFEQKQKELDLIHSSKQSKKPEIQNKVWLLWVSFNSEYPKAGTGTKLDGIYNSIETLNKRTKELENYIYIANYKVWEEDIKA